MGRPVVSLQPNLKGPDCFMPSRQGYTPLITKNKDVANILATAATTTPQLPPALARSGDGKATARFVRLIRGMIKGNRPPPDRMILLEEAHAHL